MSLTNALQDLTAEAAWEGDAEQLARVIGAKSTPQQLQIILDAHEGELKRRGIQVERKGHLLSISSARWARTLTHQDDFDLDAPTKHLQARHLHQCGLSLIPVQHGGKKPLQQWERNQESRASATEVENWLSKPVNLGIVTGAVSGVVVVDCDSDEATAWARENLPPTPITTITGKGLHKFYRHPGHPVGNRARVTTSEGTTLQLDIRGDGGYVLAPGSLHPSGARYLALGYWLPSEFESLPVYPSHLLSETEGAPGPKVERLPSPVSPGVAGSHQPEGRPDLLGRAEAWMATRKPAIAGQSGDSLTFTTAAGLVRGFCLPDDMALALMERWNATCSPPWSTKDLTGKIRSAHKSGKDPYGYLIGGENGGGGGKSNLPVKPERIPPSDQLGKRPPEGAPGGEETPTDGADTNLGCFPGVDEGGPMEPDEYTQNNDEGNARAFVGRWKRSLRYCHDVGSWFVWNSKIWKKDDTQKQRHLYVTFCHDRHGEAQGPEDQKRWHQALNNGKITAALSIAQCYPAVSCKLEDFDSKPWLFNAQNGSIDLKTGVLSSHRRGDLSTKLSCVSYDTKADCPTWRRFLLEIMGGDQELVNYLQRVVGYVMTGDTSEEAFFFCYGIGANGKSTFLEVLKFLLGDYGKSAEFSTFTEDADKAGARPDIVNLIGARLVMANESGQGKVLDTGLIKKMTGRDTMAARDLYKGMVEFVPVWKIFLVANHKPTIKDNSVGTWRRLHLIPFTVTFPEGKKDKGLRDKLLAELPGILNWALTGCLQWQEIGLSAPRKITEASKEYQDEMDPVGRFLADSCVTGHFDYYEAPAGKLFEEYKAWCAAAGEHEWSQTAFGKALAAKGYEKLRPTRQKPWRWKGIGLLTDVPDPGDKIQGELEGVF